MSSCAQISLVHRLTFHLLRVDVVVVSLLQVANLDAASALWEDGGSQDGDRNGNFLVAWKSSTHDQVEELALSVQDGASIVLAARSTASKWKARGRRLAAELHVQAAKADLSRAPNTIKVLVESTVGAANSATKDNVFFIYSVVTGHLVLS